MATSAAGATPQGVQGGNSVTQTDLPAWYQTYTQNLGSQAMGIAQGNNSQPLPAQSVADFNGDQTAAFDAVRGNQQSWQAPLQQSAALTGQIAPTAAKMVDYAQGAVGAPAANWTDPGTAAKYMSPYTTQVTDNIARLGKRNWDDNIMPGVNASMIGSGQFGSTRNADILTRAGVHAADDITGQQSNALQAGYSSAAGIFANDANRTQQQGQMQATTALNGATTATNALNTAADNMGALGQSYQSMRNTDAQSLLNIGNQQQQLQQGALTTAYGNAMSARTDPWTQLSNATGVINGIQLPKSTSEANSGQVGPTPTGLGSAAITALTAAGLFNH